MKKYLFLILLFATTLNAQIIKRTATRTYQISGDSTLTITVDWEQSGQSNVNYSGFNQVTILVDSLSGNGTFSASGTSDIEGKPRFAFEYNTGTDESSSGFSTYYTSTNDSTAIATNITWKVGVMNFEFNEVCSDGAALEFNFDAGDTLQIKVVNRFTGGILW